MSDPMSARELIVAVLDHERKWPDAPETADAILTAMPEIVRAMVVPLVWGVNPDKGEGGVLAESLFGTYHAMGDGWSMRREMKWTDADTLEEAKAAANAHHVAQIMKWLGIFFKQSVDTPVDVR